MDMISGLPEDCLSDILSRTSPRDVLRSSVVSKHFLSASKYGTTWAQFLPSDYYEIISQSSSSLPQFDPKTDLFFSLFFSLCRSPLLMHNNTQSFALDIRTGKKCFALGAKALQIAWANGDTPWYWSFKPITESRFTEGAELNYVWWLEVKGRIHVKQLSPNTKYGAYLVCKVLLDDINYTGFEVTPIKVTVLEVDEEDEGPPRNDNHDMVIRSFYIQPAKSEEAHSERVQRVPGELPVVREDGWMEIEMGRYQVGDVDTISERAVLEMTMWEVDCSKMKRSLLVQCIDLRPLD